jgi:hypothetical protein
MKIEFRIDVTPGTARRIAIVGTTVILVGVAAVAYASQIRFTSGQTLTAADLNNNFDELYARTGSSSFCAATPGTYTGIQVGGYAGAKALCTATCGSPAGRMCTEHDVLSIAQGAAFPKGWYAAPGAGGTSSDCARWASSDNTVRGTFWEPSILGFQVATCDTPLAVLCCK